ncbi:septum formation protein Maf [Parabacteroides sp. 52]|uniref:Maf-like protein n=1 Tax=unclassified Parabacteroides TaxID=2649774 RepID=UPI0013D72614|nr:MULTISPECIES: Maf-like protein [unclassified Parabacteroides]MDH6533664.1 septum formation protein [Parabacteroides sp. PM5-20]NDV54416.1 septum formation protein Maf [Parabacteroides sp. 52]
MLENIHKYKIVLGSNSPRRKELLAGLDVNFSVRTLPDVDESYPDTLPIQEVPAYIAHKKAEAYMLKMADDELLITADTIVWASDKVLGKPTDREDARIMLQALSGKEHKVITGVCLVTKDKKVSFSVTSEVRFGTLTEAEIIYYVEKYCPYDKAGAYGIQEWIGYIAVESINGSFYNVMGLPVQRLYQELKQF